MSFAALWLLDGRDMRNGLDHFQRLLGPAETARFRKFIRPERQRQYLLGRMLLRHAVSYVTGVPPAAISTIERPGLAPALSLPEGVRPPHFSLAHSRHWIACVVSTQVMLGLDIEAIDATRDVIALSEATFQPIEHEWLLGLDEAERIAAFYRMWTLKEALFKLSPAFDVPPFVDGGLRLQGDGWFACMPAHPHLSISICSTEKLAEITWVEPSGLV